MPRVLMVTPYWPPINKVGVWRALRAARYLPDYGWTPVICTPNPEQVYKSKPALDTNCNVPPVEVIQPDTFIPSIATAKALATPNHLLQRIKKTNNSTFTNYAAKFAQILDQASFRVIAEILPPDQFVEWGFQVAKQFKERQDLEIDVVWTTGGPFGFFVAGALIADVLGKPLVLDYRDPWTTHRPPRTWWIAPPQSLFRKIEAWALSKASAVGYIHRESLIANRAAFGQNPHALWSVITNGYDPIDLGDLPPRQLSAEYQAPAIVYAGNFYEERSALPVIHALLKLHEEDPDGVDTPVTLHLFGQLDKPASDYLKNTQLPKHRLRLYPRHSAEEIGSIMRGAEALLLVIGDGSGHRLALSGKLWDYMATGTPIIGIGPRVAAAKKFILDHELGVWANSDDLSSILSVFKRLSRGQLKVPSDRSLQHFHASNMSGSIAKLLNYAHHHPQQPK